MNIKKTLVLTLAAVSIAGFGSCQKTYQMVPPPITENDGDLDDEDFWGDKSRMIFVTQFGEGNMDGTSWENAYDADTFRDMLSDQTDLSKADIYLSEGTYYMSSGSVFGPEIRKDIRSVKGGYSLDSKGTDLTKRNTVEYETILSGDLNRNKKADEGDCGLLSIFSGHSTFDGIIFRHGYISETTASAKKSSAGIRVEGDSGTWAEFIGCRFEDCISHAGDGSYAGGPAVYVVSGQARLKRCEVSRCYAISRGGAIRCSTAAAVVFLDRCSIHDNSIRDDWGQGVQMSDGTICMNNTTISNNKAGNNGGTLNGAGAMLILNSTIVSDDRTAGIRCESKQGSGSFIANSIGININGNPGFILNGTDRDAASYGHNIFNRTEGNLKSSASDIIYNTDLKNFGSLKDGVYEWDNTKVTLSTWATATEIDGYAREFSPAISPGTGAVFAEWCDGFAIDQRGCERNADKLLPGAYDPKLEGTASQAIRIKADVMPFPDNSRRDLDEFGFVLTAPEDTYSYTKKIVRSGDEYLSDDGETMLWYKGTVSVAAFAPWSGITDGTVNVECPASQEKESDLAAADFVIWKGNVNPAEDLTDGRLQLNLGHANTRILVKVTVNGTPMPTSSLESISISGLKRTGTCLLTEPVPAVIADGNETTMYPYAGTDSYELITVPQTAGAGTFLVKVTYNKRQFIWTSSSEISLDAGKTSELTVNLVTTKSSAADEMTITIK